MVKIRVKRDPNGHINGFLITGHAGFAKSGKDIVCAAVSALGYTAYGALANLAGGCDFEETDGSMKCMILKEAEQKDVHSTQVIMNTIYIGFKQIENSYGRYVQVIEEEV